MKYTTILRVFLVALLFVAGCADREPVAPPSSPETMSLSKIGDGRGELNVMTWNVYVGANVDIVLGATSPEDLAMKVAAAYDTLYLTNFPERARTIAKFIQKKHPAMIGLQEVSLIQRFLPDQVTLGEELDFLQILLAALKDRGLDYRLADSVNNTDVTVPRFAGVDTSGNPIIDYVRLLDADVILVRGDVTTTSPIKGCYQAALPVQDLGIYVTRGYVSVAATVEKRTVRFVCTHLEAFEELVRLPQAQELAQVFQNETLPIIVVGDFNTVTPGPDNPFNDATYQFMTQTAGYYDSWVYNLFGNQGTGFTSLHASDLRNPYPNLYERIDLILVRNVGRPAGRNTIGPVQAEVLGDDLRERTPSGLWPSDHAGVAAKLHIAGLGQGIGGD